MVTDGEFTWSESDIDLESTAVPPALYGAFSDEPRWVDLRFARSEEQLDLNNPRFSAAVADIASAIRGVPKDELESEEVLQHRRTVRTAWAAGAALLLLALVAGAAAIFAIDQRNDARAATAAEAEARQEAEIQRAEAETQSEIAQARELTLEAERVLEFDPELSGHLALAALGALREAGEDPVQAVSALRAAIANDRVIYRVPGGGFVGVHPDGTLLATVDVDVAGGIAVLDYASGQVVERYHREGEEPLRAAFSPDGNLLAVSFDSGTITIWDRTAGESFDIVPQDPWFDGVLAFSPDGEFLAFHTGFDTDFAIEVWSVGEGRLVLRRAGTGAAFNADGLLSYVAPAGEGGESAIFVIDPASGETVHTIPTDFEVAWTAWSPDGTKIAISDNTAAAVYDVQTATEIARPNIDRARPPLWLTNDTFMLGGESVPKVIDATTGDVVMELAGQAGGTPDYDVVPGGSLVASAGSIEVGSALVVFDTSPLGSIEVAGWSAPLQTGLTAGYVGDGSRVVLGDFASYVTADALDGGNAQVVDGAPDDWWFPDIDFDGNFVSFKAPSGLWEVRSLETGEVIYEAPAGWSIRGVSSDGTKAVINDSVTLSAGRVRLVSTGDGSAIDLAVPGVGPARFSADGALVALGNSGDLNMPVIDTEDGQLLADFGVFGETRYGGIGISFSPDGTKLILGNLDGVLSVHDLETMLSGAPVDETVDLEVDAHDQLIGRTVVSPDGTMATTTAFNEPLRLWHLSDGTLLGEFGSGGAGGVHVGDFHPTRPWLLITTVPNEIRIHTLDLDELIEIAVSRLSRDMTEGECEQYFREPCPGS